MATIYDEYIYRLVSSDLSLAIDLPKDLEWVDESDWSPVEQVTEYSLTGAFLIQEGVKLKGRTITLEGKDDMSWISRADHDKLITMRNIPVLNMSFQFIMKTVLGGNTSYSNPKFSYNVCFNHQDGALKLESIKRWDNFEPETWFKIRYIRLFEIAI